MNGELDELVMVAVPRRHLIAVYELLSRPAAQPETERGGLQAVIQAQQTGAFAADAVISEWSRALLERAFRESPASIKKVFRYLAEHAGDQVPITDIAQAVGYTRPQLAGALGAFGRRVKNRYQRTTWPFTAEWDNDVRMWFYTMQPKEADVVRSLEK